MRVLDIKGNTEEKNSGKWKGYITASIAVPLDKTWKIGSDFSGLHKFVPIVEVCERLKGCNRTPGCLRFYTMNSAIGLPGGKRKAWAKDRLLNIEEETHSYTYAVEGSNMNLENCQITFKASDGKDGTTIVTWAWEVDPIKKSTKEKTLSDMSEFGCTFIKGLEAAVATTDSIDFNFEGAPLDIDTLSDADADADADGGGPYSPPVPALSLMKGRLDTLTQSLNKICQRLESGPIPADLYKNELEILQSTLSDGRRSLVNHLHGYMIDTCVGQTNKSLGSSDTSERYEEFKGCPLMSEKIVSQNNDSIETCKSDKGYEDCRLLSSDKMIVSPKRVTSKRVNALMCPDNAKARSSGDGQCQAPAAKFPKLASEEDLRVEMNNASRCAYEAFQDFSNQFQSDLRDDISHQLESMGSRLEALGFLQESLNAGVKNGPSNIHPTIESQGGNNVLDAGPREGQERAQFSTQETQISSQESSPDVRWPSSPSSNGAKRSSSFSSDGTKGPPCPSSHDANVAPSPGCQTLEDDRGQFGVWELDALRSHRLEGSTSGMHSVRFRSRLLFQDLLQKEMSQDSDHRSHETEISPGTLQPTNAIQEIRVSKGCSPYCQFSFLGAQKSPPSQYPKPVRNVPIEYHSQARSSELGRLRESPPAQNDNRLNQAAFQTKDRRYLNELETGGHDQGLQMEHQASEMYRRPLGPEGHEASVLNTMSEDKNFPNFASSKEFGEGYQQLQDNSQGWQRGGSKMCPTAQNHLADLSRPQITENKMMDGSSPEFRDNEFHMHNPLPRPSMLPRDSWPDFPHEESGGKRYSLKRGQVKDIHKEGQVEDISMKRVIEDIAKKRRGESWDNFELRREKFYLSPVSQETTRGIMREPTSPPPPPPPPQSLENYMKILHLKSKSLPPRLSHSVEPVNQMMASSSMLSLDEIPFKLGSEGTASSPVSASPSGSINPSSDFPLSAADPYGQCSEHVTFDFRNEIAPGVFHCRQGNQTRVVVNVPDDVETREEIRCHMRSLHRKDEIYKEFKLLGIQKPPTEQEILDGFAEARLQKHQELLALSETEKPPNDSPVFKPYYSDGKVWSPDVGYSPTVDKSRFEQGNDACTWDPASLSRFSAGHLTDAKPPSGQNASQPSKTKYLSCNNGTSREQLPNGRVFERVSESEQQVNVTNSFQRDASNMTSDNLRGDSTARELAMCDSSKTQTPWGGFNGRQGYKPRVQGAELSTYRHSYPPVQKTELHIKGHGQRAPHGQPSSSNTKQKTETVVSSMTESSAHATTTSSGDNACPEHKSMGSGDSFSHLERVDEISSDSARPEIRVYSQSKRRDTPAMVASNLKSRQSVVSPQSSSERSMAKIISNIQRDSEKNQMLKLMRNRSTSQQLSLDEVVDKMPSGSGSSGFEPFRTSGSMTYSESNTTASPEIRVYSEAQMLKANTHAINASSNLESRQSVVPPQSLQSSINFSMPKILSNFPQDAEDLRLLEIMGKRRPSPQLSLDEVVKNAPSESGSSEFDPFRTSGKLGSITGSGSNTSSGHSFTGQLIGHVPHFTPSGKPISLTSDQSNPLIDSSMSSDNLAERQKGRSNAMESRRHEDCPFRQLKDKLDEVIQSSGSSSPRHLDDRPNEINVRVSWADQRSECPGSSSSMGEGSGGTSSSWKNLAFSATLDRMPQGYDSSQQSDYGMLQPYDSSQQSDLDVILEEPGALLDRMPKGLGRVNSQRSLSTMSLEVSRNLDAENLQKTYRDAETQTDLPEEPEVTQQWSSQTSQIQRLSGLEGLRTRQSTQMVDSMANVAEFTSGQSAYSQMLQDPRGTQNWSSETSETPRPPGVEGLKARQSIQKIDSMANVAKFMDAQSSYSQMLDDVVGQTVESISSYKARKKKEADELSFRTRQSAQMLNSMLNVREFSDDSRSYSVWLDGVVPLSVIQTPMKDSEVQTPMNDSEIQTPWNESESGVPREPQFREDSAANFLGSVTKQILQEFGDSKRTKADANNQLDPSFPEDSMAFLGALSKQIVKEYTDYTNEQSLIEGQSEGPREPRFREQSALNFLSALSEHVIPELRDRSGSQVIRVPGVGEPRFREKSAINFLTALREQIIQGNGRSSISKLPSTSDPLPLNQLYLTEDAKSQTAIENEAYPDVNGNLQPDLEIQASSNKSFNYQPESDGQVSPDESLTYQLSSSEGQAYPDQDSSSQLKSEGQGTPGDNLSDQPELESPQYPDDGLSYHPELEGTPGESASYQPASETQSSTSEGQAYPDESLSFQPESEGQGTPGGKLSYRPDPVDQGFRDTGSRFQRKSQGQSTPGGKLSYRPDPVDQGFRDTSSRFQRKSQGQSTPGGKLSYRPDPVDQGFRDTGSRFQHKSQGQSTPGGKLSYRPDPVDQGFHDTGSRFQRKSQGQSTPGGKLSYRPDPVDQGFHDTGSRFQRKSEGQSTPGETLSDQPESEGGAYPDEGPSYEPKSEGQSSPGHQLDPDDLAFWDKGFSFESKSEGQGTPGEDLSDQPYPEGEAYPNEDLNDQVSPEGLDDELNPEGEAYPDEGLDDRLSPEGEGFPDEGLDDQLSPEDEAFPDEGLDDQLSPEGEAFPDEGLDDQTDEGWNDQPNVEGEGPTDESLSEQPEDQASENESGTSDQESHNQSQFGRNSQFQLDPRSSQRMSQRSSQVAQLNEMLQDLHTTVSRSRQNSVSNPGK